MRNKAAALLAIAALSPLAACGGNSGAQMQAAKADADRLEMANIMLNLTCHAMSATEIDCTAPNSLGVKYKLSADNVWVKQ